jgi:NRAMP (natural resistance-associated macrophage protein)-like metal ion transporter
VTTSTAAFNLPADRRNVLDRAHAGDIEGALGTVRSFDTGPRLSTRRRVGTLLAILGPGLVVMAADNDAGTMSVFAQAGQNHGSQLLWVLLLLAPVLYVTQEMVARLGAVTGAGHARLTLERFGRLWCAFSVGDLLVLNFAIIVTEFIGVVLSLHYFGVSRYLAVPLAAAALVAVTAAGNFRRWERAMYVMLLADLGLIPLALLSHPRPASIASGLIPSIAGGGSSTLLLLIALVGTTIAPWQLFFQQSTVVDKRITSRWLTYERIDTAIGAVLFIVAAGAVLIVSAGALARTPLHGHFTDAGAIASALGVRMGRPAGAIFAIALLNGSLLGASAVSLSSSYAVSEVFGVKHSLHRSWRDATKFHGCFVALVLAAAATVLIPHAPLGAITTLVQVLAGVLLPCTLVLLLLLCNDEQLLGPLTNPLWLNAIAGTAVALLLGPLDDAHDHHDPPPQPDRHCADRDPGSARDRSNRTRRLALPRSPRSDLRAPPMRCPRRAHSVATADVDRAATGTGRGADSEAIAHAHAGAVARLHDRDRRTAADQTRDADPNLNAGHRCAGLSS